MRRLAIVGLVALAACSKAPDPAATASAREIDAAVAKAVHDVDAAKAEAASAPRQNVAPEQMPQ